MGVRSDIKPTSRVCEQQTEARVAKLSQWKSAMAQRHSAESICTRPGAHRRLSQTEAQCSLDRLASLRILSRDLRRRNLEAGNGTVE